MNPPPHPFGVPLLPQEEGIISPPWIRRGGREADGVVGNDDNVN
jgi:hypothetical protein